MPKKKTPAKGKTVDDYIAGLSPDKAKVAAQLRSIIRAAFPEAEEAIKWAQPVFSSNGPFCYFKAFQSYVNFGFWRGVELDDPDGILEGTGDKMRHVKITKPADIQRDALTALIQQAVKLNAESGDPSR